MIDLKEEKELINVQEKNNVKNIYKKLINKCKFYFENFYNTRLFILLISCLTLFKIIYFYKFTMFRNETIPFKLVYMTFAFILIFNTIPNITKNKIRFWTAMLINFLISILLLVNEIYYGYSSNLISVSQISNLQYGKEISAALPNLIHIRHVVYLIDIVLVLVAFALKKNKINKNFKDKKIYGIAYLVVMVCLTVYIGNIWIKNAEGYQYNKTLQIGEASIFGYHYLDIKNNINIKKNVKYKTKNAMLEDYNALKEKYSKFDKESNEFVGLAENKNVIIVQLESVQNFVVNRKINGKEITPNLNKFLKENIHFTNMHNQSYSTTADSEYGVMTSLYPLENGMSFAQYSSNDYDDMYKLFKDKNYTTTYIHGNKGSFWNREAVYSRLSIDNLLFDNIFDENIERINEYVSDEEVYKRIVEELKKYDNKFMVNIVASSSHIAFDLPGIQNKDEKVSIDVGEKFKGEFFGNYLEAVNYADYAFGIFINELKKAGLYDDTVVLVYGDHAGLQMYNYEMIDFINENTVMNDIEVQVNYSNVLCGLKIPGVKHTIINKPVSKLDIKPTLAEICGLTDEFSLGKSMFSTKDFICINNGKIITNKYYYDGEWYEILSGNKVDIENEKEVIVEKLNEYKEFLDKELDISLSINVLNLLKK